jgi:RND family efflux transporter MFP subunit
MKKIIGIVIGVVIVLFLILGIARTRQKEEVKSIAKIQQTEGIPVFAMTVEPGSVEKMQTYYGTVRSKDQALVASKLMERIEKIYVKEGDRVKKGDNLVRFDASHSAAMVAQIKLQYQNALRDHQRMKKLLEDGAISQQTFDQVNLGYQVAKENYETAQSSVEVTAPLSGIVARVNFAEGALANPGDILVQIVNDNAYEVQFDATQEDREMLKPGLRAVVRTKEGKEIMGRLTKISFATAEETRLFTAYVDIPGSGDVYPGVLAAVDVVISERNHVIAVPIEALLSRGKGPELIVIDNGIANVRPVKLGLTGGTNVEILDGLKAGETIATYGHASVEQGQKVRIIQEEKTANNG